MNKLVVCPYDEAHKVKESRLALHITKCRSNHLDEEKFICPFNATHVLPRQERDYHISHCFDKAPVDRKVFADALYKNNPFKGNLAVPSYTESIPTVTDEVWEVDEDYDQSHRSNAVAPPVFGIMEPPALSKPAERRKMYQDLHRLPTEAERIQDQMHNVISKDMAAVHNRQPKAPSLVENKKSQEFQSLGLGRGKPVPAAPAPSRIAANIFSPTENSNISNGVNYSAALTSKMSNLGLGRGLSISQAIDDGFDDEFPALGCGRGMNRSAKSGGARYPGSRR